LERVSRKFERFSNFFFWEKNQKFQSHGKLKEIPENRGKPDQKFDPNIPRKTPNLTKTKFYF
jgi:hypothetical protein